MTFIAAQRPGTESGAERRTRFGLLLLALVAAFAVLGVAEPSPWEEVVVTALLATTLLLAFWVADVRPQVRHFGLAFAAAMVAISIVGAATGHSDSAAARLANMALVMLAPPAVVIGTTRSLRVRNQVTIDAVFGVLCLYILFGMFFAFLYGTIGRLSGSFFVQTSTTTVSHCLYFSFTTLTTVGYGDLTAASNLGHTLSVVEALTGQIYLVTVVSVIVGNLGRSRRRGGDAP